MSTLSAPAFSSPSTNPDPYTRATARCTRGAPTGYAQIDYDLMANGDDLPENDYDSDSDISAGNSTRVIRRSTSFSEDDEDYDVRSMSSEDTVYESFHTPEPVNDPTSEFTDPAGQATEAHLRTIGYPLTPGEADWPNLTFEPTLDTPVRPTEEDWADIGPYTPAPTTPTDHTTITAPVPFGTGPYGRLPYDINDDLPDYEDEDTASDIGWADSDEIQPRPA